MGEKKIIVHSSDGFIEVNAETGHCMVVSTDLEDSYLKNVWRFFLDEYKAFYGKLHDEIDILTIGHWKNNGCYSGPEPEFRHIKDLHKI